jgi:hypothetical protein
MKKGVQFDELGNFVGDFLEGMELPEGHTLFEGDITEGIYKPLFNGTNVVEGLTQAEIDALKVVPPDPDAELVKAIQAATTLDELKSALIGSVGIASVKGKMK